jgi:formate hydrogenlyase transcriptional activator
MNDERIRMLLVEDDPIDRMAFSRFMESRKLPYDYTIAESTQSARKHLASERFDIVISDYSLGDGTCLDLLNEYKDSPLVVVTGTGSEAIAVKAMRLGARDYLIKDSEGCYLTVLPATVQNVLARCAAEADLKRHREHLEEMVRERTAELVAEIQERKRVEGERESLIRQVEQKNRALESALGEVRQLKERLEAENVYLREEILHTNEFQDIVGRSAALRRVLEGVAQVAPTDATVLLLGETGTGKEVIARAIHARSRRNDKPLIAVNCAALPSTLMESELFGHEKGAFSGALIRQLGRFEVADKGTLLLDEVGELASELQAKLLRVLQEGTFERVGSSQTIRVDVRVIAASNRDLAEAVRLGRFRADLYYRLNVFPIQIPPLRQRQEDIPLLVWHFIAKKQRRLGTQIQEIPQEVMRRLQAYDWPGNIRELENVIEQALILSPRSSHVLDKQFVMQRVGSPATSGSQSLEEAERAAILNTLAGCGWKIKGKGNAADRLGIKPSTLYFRMKKLGISREESSRHG